MLVKTVKGMFHLQKNYKEAFALEEFESKYIEECLDKYLYIVGDLSSDILRLKGFDNDPSSPSFFRKIDEYLEFSCAFGCPFYVLRRVISEDQYNRIPEHKKKVNTDANYNITPIQKENFDKESLVLESTPKVKPNIVIDMAKINAIPKGELSSDLKEIAKNEKVSQSTNSAPKAQAEDVTQSYVSASPDFDPSKSNSAKFNKQNNYNKNRNNGNKNNNKKKNKK